MDLILVQNYPEATVGALIVNRKREILLVRSYKWGTKYTVPGGHIELGERSETAVKREVKEEVGLNAEPVRLLLVQEAIYPANYIKHEHYVFLDYLCLTDSSDVKLDGKEIQEYIWKTPSDALQLDLESFTRNLVEAYMRDVGVKKER
ncbi:MAG TPA: NUDIX domain-containing protein [Candidatus Acidoferrum sp.]|nr:NUDIX domain-containing protein [Candidatus Acidoferrum sp.]